ncbi:hypothetical protein [Gracilibacillus salinarum]|uniref:Uncharacterized protein n=1 Tax=Gracilibacillus salinarum TaxID=2932255 RepID=A0ABY4GPM1_9BACI|nr:hypothetical protein [Gracilibacillus salinarum]UOQ85667.1 hypothetical protein MUN87_01810 [Gracilibacillus salinarum]
MDLGVAASIRTKQISGEFIEGRVNQWLEENADTEVIDIKFAASATHEDWATDALIIYRKGN